MFRLSCPAAQLPSFAAAAVAITIATAVDCLYYFWFPFFSLVLALALVLSCSTSYAFGLELLSSVSIIYRFLCQYLAWHDLNYLFVLLVQPSIYLIPLFIQSSLFIFMA